ncbi:hypothetical protein CC2G_013446 [Coprinopsis cinerea AmutBmut pab1-1]|nr:hypothetical protein CC2G_013446 [Coprinopsis cinerea AmutBmut pab1-1]
MAPVPSKLVEDARRGRTDALRDLGRAITRDNYTTRILDAILPHFQPELLPGSYPEAEGRGKDVNFQAALFSCLGGSIISCDRSTPLRTATIDKLVPNLDGIFSWFLFYLASATQVFQPAGLERAIHTITWTIYRIAELVPEEHVLFSPKVIKVLVVIWCTRRKDTRQPYCYIDPERCGTVAMMSQFSENPDAWSTLMDQVVSSQEHLDDFCTAFLQRIDQVPSLYQPRGFPLEYVGAHAALLLDIASKLVKIRAIHQKLREQGLLRRIVQAIVPLCPDASPDAIFTLSFLAFRLSYQPFADPVKGVAEVVKAGIMPVMFEGLQRVGFGGSDSRSKIVEAGKVFRALSAFTFYPRTVKAFRTVVEATPQTVWDNLRRRRGTAYPSFWSDFLAAMDSRVGLMR